MTGDKLWRATFLQPQYKLHSAWLNTAINSHPSKAGAERESDHKEPIYTTYPVTSELRLSMLKSAVETRRRSHDHPRLSPLSVSHEECQPVLTRLRRVKSTLNESWICEMSQFGLGFVSVSWALDLRPKPVSRSAQRKSQQNQKREKN